MTTMSYEEFRRKYRALMKDDEDLSPTRLDEMEKHAVACKNCRVGSRARVLATGNWKNLTIVGCGSFRRGWIEITRKNRRKLQSWIRCASAHLDNLRVVKMV